MFVGRNPDRYSPLANYVIPLAGDSTMDEDQLDEMTNSIGQLYLDLLDRQGLSELQSVSAVLKEIAQDLEPSLDKNEPDLVDAIAVREYFEVMMRRSILAHIIHSHCLGREPSIPRREVREVLEARHENVQRLELKLKKKVEEAAELERLVRSRDNELLASKEAVIRLKHRQAQVKERPSADMIKGAIDEYRFKTSQRVNLTEVGKKFGVHRSTARSWIANAGLTRYARLR